MLLFFPSWAKNTPAQELYRNLGTHACIDTEKHQKLHLHHMDQGQGKVLDETKRQWATKIILLHQKT
jgi:hypothetical protein